MVGGKCIVVSPLPPTTERSRREFRSGAISSHRIKFDIIVEERTSAAEQMPRTGKQGVTAAVEGAIEDPPAGHGWQVPMLDYPQDSGGERFQFENSFSVCQRLPDTLSTATTEKRKFPGFIS